LKLLILYLLPVEIDADFDPADDKRSRRFSRSQAILRNRRIMPAVFGYDFNLLNPRPRAIASLFQTFAGGIHESAFQLKSHALHAGHHTDGDNRLVIYHLQLLASSTQFFITIAKASEPQATPQSKRRTPRRQASPRRKSLPHPAT